MANNKDNCEQSVEFRVNQLLSRIESLNEQNQQLSSKIVKLESVLRKHNITICYHCGNEAHNDESQCTENSAQTILREASYDAITDTHQKNTSFSEEQTTTLSTMKELDSCVVVWDELNQMPKCLLPLPTLKPDNNTFLYIKVPLQKNSIPKPYPAKYKHIYDSRYHVMMPCSAQNQNEESGEQHWLLSRWSSTSVSKWKIISNTFSQTKIKTPQDLVNAIKNWVPMMNAVNFNALLTVLDEYSHQKSFFDVFIPQLIKLTLGLPSIVTKPVNLLKHGLNATIFLSQQQIACLLANAFFCTYPKRLVASVEYYDYPSINFMSLFTNDYQYENQKVQKLKCIMNYFLRVIKDIPKGVVSFERRCLAVEEVPNWSQSNKKLCKLNVCSDGLIERDGTGLLQVHFGSMFVGGAVLDSECAQEDIRFVIFPELIISRLFTEKLHDNEVLIVKGCEQFNDYSGYGKSFEWKQNFVDNTQRDEWDRRYTTVVAMDAIYFDRRLNNRQYKIKLVERELNKAYCGFYERTPCDASNKSAIVSGKWGCGASNGNPQLKSIIQLMAASQADRYLLLFTFNDVDLKSTLQRFYQFLVSNEFTVSRLYRALNNYDKYVRHSMSIKLELGVIDYIMEFEDKDFGLKLSSLLSV